MRLLRSSFIPATPLWARCYMGHWRMNSDHDAVPVLDLTLSTSARLVRQERDDNQITVISGRSQVRGVGARHWVAEEEGCN